MPRLRIILDIGADTTIGRFSRVINDLAVVSDAATRWANLEVEQSSRRTIERLDNDLGSLADRAERLENEEDRQEYQAYVEWQRLQRDLLDAPFDLFVHEWQRMYRRFSKLGRPFSPPFTFAGNVGLEQFAPHLFRHLLEDELSRRRPDPPTLERALYENPFDAVLYGAAIIVGGGGVFGTLPQLIKLGRDWTNDRRRNAAAASKAEYEAEIMKLLLERSRRGARSPSAEELMDAVFDDQTRAALTALGLLDPTWQELDDDA